MEADVRANLMQRLEYLKAMRAARERLPEVAAVIAAAESDEDALAGIRSTLGCSEIAASVVYNMQLRRLRVRPQDALTAEIAEVEQLLEDG
ncbi:hypothetical protein [Leifsonia shinshuensis]|uniref:DNA gyrase/topoisomerase IV subunit A n=1 Tax=Leifsonia shinshuensis TaxID=150026 RepID=A0A853CVI0_9MICO|nr:hypothetical protein [Leifsonia shinshuensis]NYJ24432.1 DNA gyrase/topoisomerase IV subunit A [Leifsonia shinshuensis]